MRKFTQIILDFFNIKKRIEKRRKEIELREKIIKTLGDAVEQSTLGIKKENFNDLSEEEQKEIARKAGSAAGKAFCAILDEVLEEKKKN